MSLTIKENNESSNLISNIIKLKGDLISDTSLKTNHISQKNSNTKLLISKDKLRSIINDTKKYFKNNKLVKHKTKITFIKKSSDKLKSDEINKKRKKKVLNVNDKNNIRKKGNINIITDNINNYKFNSELNNGNISKTQLVENENYDNNSFENNFSLFKRNNFHYFDTYNYKNYLTNDKSDEYNKNIYNLYISNSHLILNDIEKRCKEYLLYYNCDARQYNIKVINDIISDQNKHIVSEFKNYLLWDDSSEYLKRYYYINEIKFRLKPIASYYISYTYFSPVYYCNLEIIKILLKNVKRKNNYYKEIENFEDKIQDENDNNSISSFFEERKENLDDDDTESDFNNIYDKKKNNFDFVPIIDSSDINKKSQVSSINKKSLSLSITLKNCEGIIDSNIKTKKSLLKEKDKTNDNNDTNDYKFNLRLNKNNLFNTSITPIKKKCNTDKLFNDEFQFKKLNFNAKKDLNGKSNKENNKNELNLNSKKNEHEFKKSKNKNKGIKCNEEKINLHKNKISELHNKIKDKKFKSYRTTDDMNILLSNNIDQSKEIIYVKKQSYKKEEKRNDKKKEIKNIINQKTILNTNISNNNFEKNASIIFNKNNLKKFQINNESKLMNSINCLSHRNRLLNDSNKINNVISKDYSLIIHNKNNHLNNSINAKNNNMKIKMNFNNIIRNINHKYIKINKFPRLLTSNDRKNNFSSKKSLEFPFKFHSLSSNRKRLLKISDSYNSKGILKNIIPTTIYFNQKNNSFHNSLLKKNHPTLKNTSKKHKKGKSDVFSFKKRNNLILSTTVQNNINNKNIISDMKKNLVIDNKKKIGAASLKNKNFIKSLIDNFKNCNKRDNFLKNKNKNNKTFKNIIKSININKIMSNNINRKCKSKSPTITTTNQHKNISKINKTRTNLKLLNSIFIVSNNILNEVNNNKNVHNNLMSNNINNTITYFDKDAKGRDFGNCINKKIHKKMKTEMDNFNLNNEYIKPNNTRATTINNINLSLNLNNQHYKGKSDSINIINSENINKNKYFIVKNNIKSSKIFQIEEKKVNNNNLKSKDKIKINKNSKTKSSNNNNKFSKITSNKVKQHHKKVSIQLNQDKNIINKNIIKNDLNKRKSLNHKNMLFPINISNNQSKNSLIKNFKNNFNSVINDDYSEYLSERKHINNEINANNSNNNLNLNSYSKDKKSKYSYMILPNKNIYSLKNKILLCRNTNDKVQNKQNIEDKIINSFRNYNISGSKNCLHKKSLTNISSFLYDIHLKKHSNNYFNRNIHKYNNRNNMSNEFSLKKSSKSNYNEFLLNDPIKSLINNNYFIKSDIK